MAWDHVSIIWQIGGLSLMILLAVYISEKVFRPTWPGLSKPITLTDVLRDWLLYMVMFISLTVLLEKIVSLACWTIC